MAPTKFARRSLRIVLLLMCGFQPSMLYAQSPSPSSLPPSATPTPMQVQLGDADRYLREGMKGMAEDSRALTGWGLTLIGASILAIASTSYLRPLSRKVRLAYLLFIPGWLLIALSVYYGNKISRRYTAVTFTQKRDILLQIGNAMNSEFASQLTYFQWGLVFFSIWLLFYIVWWVFVDLPVKSGGE